MASEDLKALVEEAVRRARGEEFGLRVLNFFTLAAPWSTAKPAEEVGASPGVSFAGLLRAALGEAVASAVGGRESATNPVTDSLRRFGFAGAPVVALLGGLFGRQEDHGIRELRTRFELPPPIRVEAGLEEGRMVFTDADQFGRPRAQREFSGGPNITIQVQAMDSRSFLDHSGEIALAVRQALLESHILGDVLAEG